MKVLALTRYGRLGASSRLRTLQFLPELARFDLDITVSCLFDDELLRKKNFSGKYGAIGIMRAYGNRLRWLLRRKQFDLLWIEKEALPWVPPLFEEVLLAGTPYLLDYDDAVFHNYDLHRLFFVRWLLGRRIDRLMKRASLVIGGNDYLVQRARNSGAARVEYVPTVIDWSRYEAATSERVSTESPCIVWIGSPSTLKYLVALQAPLATLATRCKFRLRVIGGVLEMPGLDVDCIPWSEDSEVRLIAECDIGVMPLSDSAWERGKCGYKLIQYMACGLPVVASPVGVNSQIVLNGVNGFLAASEISWVENLELLLCSASLRRAMGVAGRERVEAEYSVQRVAPRLAALLQGAGAR